MRNLRWLSGTLIIAGLLVFAWVIQAASNQCTGICLFGPLFPALLYAGPLVLLGLGYRAAYAEMTKKNLKHSEDKTFRILLVLTAIFVLCLLWVIKITFNH